MLRPLLWCCALAAVLAVTPAGLGQDVKPAAEGRGTVHKMVIQNGPTRTVRYFGEGISEGERAMLRDLERAENETAYLHNLQELRANFVSGELNLMARRQAVQDKLYGRTITTTTFGGYGAGLGLSLGAYPSAYPYYPLASAFPSRYYYPSAIVPAVAERTTITRGLGEGVGPQSALEVEMAKLITQQATPEYAASVERNYQTALTRAYGSDSIRVALGGPEMGGGTVFAGFGEEAKAPFTLTLKSGEKISGKAMKTEGEWYVLETPKENVKVRQSDVVRIDELKNPPKE